MIGLSKGNQLTPGKTGLGNQSETRPVSLKHTQRKEKAGKTKAGFGDTLGDFVR